MQVRSGMWLWLWNAVVIALIPRDTVEALVRIPLHSPPTHSRDARIHRHTHHAHSSDATPSAMMMTLQHPQHQQRHHHHAWRDIDEQRQRLSHLQLRNIDDYLFSASIAIGSPPQNFTVMLDTGSTDAWVPGQRCGTCGTSHSQFRRLESTSFDDLDQKFHGAYGSGSSDGEVVRDVLTLGAYTVPGFVFALITHETGDIPNFATDGVLGLAFPGMRKIKERTTLLDAIMAAHPEMEPVFAFRLTRSSDPAPSEFHLGGLDLAAVGHKPRIAYFPVLKLPRDDALTYWTIALDDFHTFATTLDTSENGQPVIHRSRDLCEPFCYAIIDSGSSLIYAPPQIYDQVIHAIARGLPDCDLETRDCYNTTHADFPSLSFTFGDGNPRNYKETVANAFVLRPESYVRCEDDICTIMIKNHGNDLFWWVLGDSFLQAYYTAFEFGDHKRVGIVCDDADPDCYIGA